MRRALLALAALGLTALSPVETQQVLDNRQAEMKDMRTALGGFVPMLKGDKPWDPPTVAKAADRIRADAARLHTRFDAMFPDGTDSEKVFTMALPAIWQRRDEFQAAARTLEAAATRMGELGASRDAAKLTAQVGAINTACTDCHQAFRVRR